ncbi:MAG: c-type cytochrome [Gammaproteobacteria bacterium]
MRTQALLLMALAAMTTGCERADNSVDISEGAALFAANCAVCHGPQGNVRQAESYDADTPDLREIAQNAPGGRFPQVALAEVIDGRRLIEGHTRSMPTWGEALGQGDDEVAKAKIDLLIAYIKSIQQ